MGVISRAAFNTGDTPTAALWNKNFDDAYTAINGNLDANNLAAGAVTKTKLGTMEYVASFSYPVSITATAENIRTMLWPYAGTLTQIDLIAGHISSAFAIDIGMADMNSPSIASSFIAGSSISVTASASPISLTGAQLANTTISANTRMILTVKSVSANCGTPLLVNLKIDVG